ncbi:hypothetical protein L3Q67_26410 [Saccharothrix sp. AJ9571]|nr:hypothetical protein L3Q67_26410 [Saccharothrix sp. AJ9571]
MEFGTIERTGSLVHDDERRLLMLLTDEGSECISVNLARYGLIPRPGNVFIKNWSEHAGLTACLERDGLVMPVRTVTVGAFASTAYEVEITF